MKFTAHTDTGLRRTENEDRFYAEGNIFVVADGMGGHRSGAEAAQRAVDAFVAAIRAGKPGDEAARAANEAVLAIEGGRSSCSPGSTLTAIVITENRALLVHAGDSEAWRIGLFGVEKLTEDHGTSYGLENFCGIGEEFRVDIAEVPALPGDRFVLASDGLSKHVMQCEIDGKTAEDLVDLANGRGGKDNTTVIVIDI